MAVKRCSVHHDSLIVLETPSSFFYYRKSLWQNIIQHLFGDFIHLFLQGFNLLINSLLGFGFHVVFFVQLLSQLRHSKLFFFSFAPNNGTELICFCSKFIIRKILNGFIRILNLFQNRQKLFIIPVCFGAEYFFQKIKHIIWLLVQ